MFGFASLPSSLLRRHLIWRRITREVETFPVSAAAQPLLGEIRKYSPEKSRGNRAFRQALGACPEAGLWDVVLLSPFAI